MRRSLVHRQWAVPSRASSSAAAALASKDRFAPRHLGPRESDLQSMLQTVRYSL